MKHIYIFCDQCSKHQTVAGKVARGDGRGWLDGDREYALALGWKIDGDYDVCPECQEEEAQAAIKKATGVRT